MTKQQIISQIIEEMRIEAAQEKTQRETAYYSALGSSKEFAKADAAVRALIAKGENSAELKAAIAKRDKLAPAAAKSALCSKCKNTGYVKGKLCPCVTTKCTKKLLEQSGFSSAAPRKFDEHLADVFKEKNTKDYYKKVYNGLARYCEKFPKPLTPNIVFWGATGTGKTFAAQIIAYNLMERGFSVLYTTAFALADKMRKKAFSFDETAEGDELFETDLLVIDDVGAEPNFKNNAEYFYTVINERLTKGKPFIITTNLSPDDLRARYDERIASRILWKQKSAVIELKSEDLRLHA